MSGSLNWEGRPERLIKDEKVVRNSVTLIATRIFTKIATTLIMVYVARRLGDADFGLYATILAIVAFASLVEEFGLSVPLIRSIARRTGDPGAALGKVMLMKVPLGIGAGLVFFGAASISHLPFALSVVFAASLFFEVQALSVTRSFEGAEQMKYIGLITIVERTVFCGAGFLVLYSGLGLIALGFVSLASNIIAVGMGLTLFARRIAPLKFSLSWTDAKERMREALPFVVAGLFSVLYNRADVFILSMHRGAAEVGWFNAATRVLEAQSFIPLAIIGSVFPVLSRNFRSSFSEFKRVHARVFYLFIAVGAALAGLTFLFSDTITIFLYTSQYANAGPVLRNMAVTIFFFSLNLLVGNALIAASKEGYSTATLGFGALVNVVANYFAVPVYGASAAALIRAASEALSFGIQAFFLYRVVGTLSIFGFPANDRTSVAARGS